MNFSYNSNFIWMEYGIACMIGRDCDVNVNAPDFLAQFNLQSKAVHVRDAKFHSDGLSAHKI